MAVNYNVVTAILIKSKIDLLWAEKQTWKTLFGVLEELFKSDAKNNKSKVSSDSISKFIE